MASSRVVEVHNRAHFRLGSKTVLTPLKWDVCITPESRHRSATLPIAMSSSATATPNPPTGTWPQRCIEVGSAPQSRKSSVLYLIDHSSARGSATGSLSFGAIQHPPYP